MSATAEFFSQNIIIVFFIYGLSFFVLGLAVLLERGHATKSDFAYALLPLGLFGIVHGTHEWIEMYLLIHGHIYNEPSINLIFPLRLVLLAASFLLLIAFGARLIMGRHRRRAQLLLIAIILCVYILGLVWVFYVLPSGINRPIAADVYTRYSLAIPGAVLAAWGLLVQRRKFKQVGLHGFARDVLIAALAFFLYGCIGQLFASPSPIFPSNYLNMGIFVQMFGFPVQVFRAAMAAIVAIFIIRSLRAFEIETRNQIEELRTAQMEERRKLEDTRAELLHRTVRAQEAERQRIARELHDETGQTLTALGLGLRALTNKIDSEPEGAIEHGQQLEKLAVDGLEELQSLVSGLRPPQLDDLGLMAALRWCANEMIEHYKVQVDVVGEGNGQGLPPDVRVVLFRIAQEAVTNVVRHAGAAKATISLIQKGDGVKIQIVDDGVGFDVNRTLNQAAAGRCWGLLGMMERASLIGGSCDIFSTPGVGTQIKAAWDFESGEIDEGD